MLKFSRKLLKEIAKKYQIADIHVFGSQVAGHRHPGSDFDIAVRFEKELPEASKRGKIYGDLFSELTSCFKKDNLDLVFLDEIPLHFQFKITTEGELMYSKDIRDSFNFKEKIINYYRDYKYFIDEFFAGLLKTSVKT
jgi:predicted nucleotidyltransferase